MHAKPLGLLLLADSWNTGLVGSLPDLEGNMSNGYRPIYNMAPDASAPWYPCLPSCLSKENPAQPLQPLGGACSVVMAYM